MPSEIPARIDRYHILEMLGRGSMGDVYLAVDPKLDRRLALKVMSSPRLDEQDGLSELRMRFVQEARAAARLSHPGIVTIYDADTDPETGWPFIAMELVPGASLRHRLRSQPLDIPRTLELISQVARALDYAHSEGVVHRDIKPANLLLDQAGTQVKIADFGVAKLVSNSLTLTGQVLGSPNYMAPEQVRAEAIDGRTDLFGLGVVLYECLAGRPAFASESLAAITFKIVSVDPRPLEIYNPHVPRSLSALVARALEKRPENRFQSGGEMAEALDEVARELLGAEPLSRTREIPPIPPEAPEPADLRESPTTLTRRGPWRALAAALISLAAFLGVAQWAVEPANGELPLLTRQLGLFKATDPSGREEKKPAEASEEPDRPDTLVNQTEDPSAPESPAPESPAPESPALASPSQPTPALTSPLRDESPARPADPPPEAASSVQQDGALETEEARPALDPVEAEVPPEAAETRLTLVVDNKIRLAMVSVWIDGERRLTRRLHTKGMLKRWVGQDYQFDIPVNVGERKIEVHVSGLSSRLEARGVIRAELAGEASVLEVEIDRRREKLNLSWRNGV